MDITMLILFRLKQQLSTLHFNGLSTLVSVSETKYDATCLYGTRKQIKKTALYTQYNLSCSTSYKKALWIRRIVHYDSFYMLQNVKYKENRAQTYNG